MNVVQSSDQGSRKKKRVESPCIKPRKGYYFLSAFRERDSRRSETWTNAFHPFFYIRLYKNFCESAVHIMAHTLLILQCCVICTVCYIMTPCCFAVMLLFCFFCDCQSKNFQHIPLNLQDEGNQTLVKYNEEGGGSIYKVCETVSLVESLEL